MELLVSVMLFVLFGAAFVFVNLLAGKLVRPKLPHADKSTAYECGELPVGGSWVQFDLRFYIIALVFLVFDVEVALFYPWAIAYGDAAQLAHQFTTTVFAIRLAALIDMLFFFCVLMVGFAYLWRFGYLDWVRSSATTTVSLPHPQGDTSDNARDIILVNA